MNPLDELKALDQQVDQITELEALKPVFFRLDEIARANPDDFEVQLVVGDIKQHLVNRGTKIKEQMVAGIPAKPAVAAGPPPLPPGANAPLPEARPSTSAPTVKIPPRAPAPPPVSPAPPPPSAPPIPAAPQGSGARSPLDGPAPLSALRPESKPPEFKPPPRLMSSGQFAQPSNQPAAPVGPPPIPGPAAGAPAAPSATPGFTPASTPISAPISSPISAPIANPSAPPPMAAPPMASPPVRPASPPPMAAPPPIAMPPIASPPVRPASPPPIATPPVASPPVRPVGPPPIATPPMASSLSTPQAPPAPPMMPSSRPPMAAAGVPTLMATSTGPLATGPQPLPTARTANPPIAPQQPPPPKSGSGWKGPMLIGAILGAILALVGIAFLVNQARKRNLIKQAETAAIEIPVTTTPPNASIRVNGETKCNAPCSVSLAPGSYQVTAFLDGYDPATSALSVNAGQPAALNLTLTAQPQTVRILTDLETGKITIDDQPPADLQEGQFIVDNIKPGSHTVKVAGRGGDATFTFEIAEAKPPAVTGPVTTHNLVAVLVSSLGNQAHVVTNSGPLKLAVNGQAEADASPAGVDLKTFQSGVDELVVGEGKDQKNMKESFGPAPMLTAFLKSDLNIGTLIVSTGEDNVSVFLNDKPYQRKTARGQLRIPAIGKVTVRVAKDGFQAEAAQIAEVKKGSEVRLEFKLKPMPTVATLQIRGATPGATVLIDQNPSGTIGADGSLTLTTVSPGNHTVELRHEGYQPKRFQRSFSAGQTMALGGADVAMTALPTNGTIRVARTPANATITYKRSDDSEVHELRAPQVEVPAGTYIFTAKAQGYTDKTQQVQVAAGESKTIEIAMVRERPAAPVLKNGDITDFEDPGAWKKEGELWVHKGGGVVPYKLGPRGVYTFTVELVHGGNIFRGGRIRWVAQYVDAKNYLMYEMDRKTFWAEVVENGKKYERQKTPHQLDNQKAFTIQIEITPDHIVHRLKTGEQWLTLDSFAEPGRNFTSGKFGFLIQGSDEIGVSDFTFQPK